MLASFVTRELAIPVSISATQTDCVASSQKMKFVQTLIPEYRPRFCLGTLPQISAVLRRFMGRHAAEISAH